MILPRLGSAYQLVASAGSGGNINWTSSDPQAVAVSGTGLVTALTQTGSATITATAPGASPATASVIVAAPDPHTVLLNSADVQAVQGTQVTLAANPSTNAIAVGDIVVSGDKAGILRTVQSKSSANGAVTLQTGPASLVQAFPDLSIHLTGAPVTLNLQVTRGRTSLLGPGGRAVAMSRDALFPCTDSNDAAVNATLSGPTFSAPIQAQLDTTLVSRAHSVQSFRLLVNATIPARIETGSVTFAANGQTDFTCKAELPIFSLPAVPIGPILIEGTWGAAAGISVSANAHATLTLKGPSFTDTFTANDGIEWTPATGWESVLLNSSTGPVLDPPGFQFTAQVHGKVSAFLRDDVGIVAKAAHLDVAGVDFAFDKLEGSVGFAVDSPLAFTAAGYAGPTWGAGLEHTAGPELRLAGGVADLLEQLGVSPDLKTWNLYDNLIPLGGSPAPKLSASAAAVSQGGAEILTVTQPARYAGSAVKFYAFPATGTPIEIGSAVVGTTGTAAFTWSPSAGQNGAYQVGAFLFGDVFGAAGFPYPSNQVAVKAGGGNVNTTIH